MCKKIDHLINQLPSHSNLSLQDKVPLLLRKFVPQTAIICDAQLNEQNQLSWAIVYQDGTDTFIHICNDEVYAHGNHENEIVEAMQQFIDHLQRHALQRSWYKQLSLGFFEK